MFTVNYWVTGTNPLPYGSLEKYEDIMQSIKLDTLTRKIDNIDIQYEDIVNYEIARENICSYIFFLSRKVRTIKLTKEINIINGKIAELIYIRDHLQIEDLKNISLVFSELIPEYKRKLMSNKF